MIDLLILWGLFTTIHFLVGTSALGQLFIISAVLVSICYFSVFHRCFGSTPGQYLLRLKLISSRGEEVLGWEQSFKRNLLFFGSLGLSGLVLIFRSQGAHDAVSETKTVYWDPLGEPPGFWRVKVLLVLSLQAGLLGLSYYWVQRTSSLARQLEVGLKQKGLNFGSLTGTWIEGFKITEIQISPNQKIKEVSILLESPYTLLIERSLIIKNLSVTDSETNHGVPIVSVIALLLSPQSLTHIVSQLQLNFFEKIQVQDLQIQSDKFSSSASNITIRPQQVSWSKLRYSSPIFDAVTGSTSLTSSSIEMKNSVGFKIYEIPNIKLQQPLDFQYYLSFVHGQIQNLSLNAFSSKLKISKPSNSDYQLSILSLNFSDFIETGFPGENLSLHSKAKTIQSLFSQQPDYGFFTFGDAKFNFDGNKTFPVRATHRRGSEEYELQFPENFLLSVFASSGTSRLRLRQTELSAYQITRFLLNSSAKQLSESENQKLDLTLKYFGHSARSPANQ